MVAVCLVVYFKICEVLVLTKLYYHIYLGIENSTFCLEPFFQEIFISISLEANIPPMSLENNMFFCIAFYWPHLSFFQRKGKFGILGFLCLLSSQHGPEIH